VRDHPDRVRPLDGECAGLLMTQVRQGGARRTGVEPTVDVGM
jgi:hypothetical protein